MRKSRFYDKILKIKKAIATENKPLPRRNGQNKISLLPENRHFVVAVIGRAGGLVLEISRFIQQLNLRCDANR